MSMGKPNWDKNMGSRNVEYAKIRIMTTRLRTNNPNAEMASSGYDNASSFCGAIPGAEMLSLIVFACEP